jgi:Asp-tRNA(Asn)/Glu-tRNA(Gln) amidotransferase A subunit family amidase
LGADVAARFAWAATVTEGAEAKARAVLAGFRERADEALGDGVLVLPTTPTAAPLRTADAAELDAVRSATITLTCLASILGRPAVSAPVLESEGAPAGLSLVGPRGSDLDLVARASGIANL